MNTNIKITFTDSQRDHIKNLIDGQSSNKLASRKEVSDLIQMFTQQLLESKMSDPKNIIQETIEQVSGYKYFSDGQEIDYDKWIDIPCNDCGCMVSVSEAIINDLNTN